MVTQVSAPLLNPAEEHGRAADHDAQTTQEKTSSTYEQPPPQIIGGAIFEITWALICLSLPMLVLTAVFLGFVYGYEISNSDGASQNLLGDSSLSIRDSSAYYIDYSATRLATISSWTSTATSFTTTFVMVLISYPLARDFVKKSNSGALDSLPTPYQLNLIIGILQGGYGPLWSWYEYLFWRGRNRQPSLLWAALLSVVVGTALSLGILGADTWLHIVTTTVNLDILSAPTAEPSSSYGRSLVPTCYNQTYTPGDINQCIGGLQLPSQIHFDTASEATRTAMNLSTLNAALSCNIDGKNFAYLTAAQRSPNLDFQARTFALSTTCAPASTACDLHQIQYCGMSSGCSLGLVQMTLGMPYNCSKNLYGDLDNGTGSAFDSTTGSSFNTVSNIGFFLQMFRKQNFVDPIGAVSGQEETPNPFYFAYGGTVSASDSLAAEPEAVQSDLLFNSAFIFNCTATVYELDYTSINGTVSAGNYTKANATLTNNVGWTLLNARALTRNNLESAFISGAQETNTTAEFANFFAQEFSRSTISTLAGITADQTNAAEQVRETRLVTRLPKAPFFTLIVLNLLFALLGIILAIVALMSQPRKTRNMQARLSVAGLVAAMLEANTAPRSSGTRGIESMFAEYHNDSRGTQDPSRVMLVNDTNGSGNRVFEKVSLDGSTAPGVAAPVATSRDPYNSIAFPPPEAGSTNNSLTAQQNQQHRQPSPVVARKPVSTDGRERGSRLSMGRAVDALRHSGAARSEDEDERYTVR